MPAAKKEGGAAAKKAAAPRRAKKTTSSKPASTARTPAKKPEGAPRFAVVGTGRSGTGYVAELLRASGANCGHEGWWRPDGTGDRTPGLDGDSSWLALPDLESRAWSGPVAHVVRHPVAVVRSLVGTRLFHPDQADGPYARFAREHCPEVDGLPPLEAAVEWWVAWNTRCAAVADVKLRVEDLRKGWALAELGDALGVRIDRQAARRVSTAVNHRTRANVDPLRVWQLLDRRADRFGYRR